ncbi:MAG: thioesterase family protein [Bacteroidales bacterium]
MKKHRLALQIRFNDIDMLGHVNNVMFGHYCDAGRYGFMRDIMPHNMDFMNDHKVLILVHTEFDFMVPCFITDQLFVETTLEKTGEKSVHLIQEIVDDKGLVRVRSRSVMSTYDKKTGKSFPVPKEWIP